MRFAERLVVFIFACASLAAKPADSELQKHLKDSLKELKIPGAVVVAVKDGQVLFVQPLGLRDVANDKSVTADTYFYIASCTKSFTSMGIMILADEGKIELDAPVKKYLPKFQIADEKLTETMTVRDLLCHRWGLDGDHITFGEAFSGLMTEEMFYEQLKDAQARGSFRYTNLHYTILGRVIESVSGMSWKDFLAERIFKPAAMNRTTAYASVMYGDTDVALPYAYSISGDAMLAPLRKADRTMHAAGGIGTTGSDVARWLLLNLNDGEIDGKRIVTETACRAMQQLVCEQHETRQIISKHEHTGYGLGWGTGDYRGHTIVQHNGGYGGAAAHISFMPDKNIGVAVFANTDGPAGGWVDVVAFDVYDRMLGVTPEEDVMKKFMSAVEQNARRPRRPLVTEGQNPAAAPDGLSQPASAYVGTYSNPTLGEIRIELKDQKTLTLQLGELRPPMLTAGRDQFNSGIRGLLIRAGSFKLTDGVVSGLEITFEDDEVAEFERRIK